MRNVTSVFALALLASCTATAEWPWPMSNDPAFDATVRAPAHPEGQGPRILLDGAHHNFFVQWDFIRPFADLAAADGYRPVSATSRSLQLTWPVLTSSWSSQRCRSTSRRRPR